MQRSFRAALAAAILPLLVAVQPVAFAQGAASANATAAPLATPAGAFPAPTVAAASYVLIDM
jgi:hypothetical protein